MRVKVFIGGFLLGPVRARAEATALGWGTSARWSGCGIAGGAIGALGRTGRTGRAADLTAPTDRVVVRQCVTGW